MKKYILIILSLVLLLNCTEQKPGKKVNGKSLEALVVKALNGDLQANLRLSGLNDEYSVVSKNYQKLKIDSTDLQNKKIYTVVVEYPDPLYNYFALYDDELKFYLLDKSVNGTLNMEWDEIGDDKFLFVQENFISQKVLQLERISIYSLIDTSINLVYRSFSKMKKGGAEYIQTIKSISDTQLVTYISSSGEAINLKGNDNFRYDPYLNIYTSRNNTFTNFVVGEINKLNRKPKDISTTDVNREITYSKNGFSIKLSEEWREIQEFTITKNLKKESVGFRYVNNSIGANISIIKLKDNELTSDYTDVKLGKPTQGQYSVRVSELLEKDNLYIQFIEHSCSGNKFLLLFECSRYTYEQSREYYDSILDSFFIEC